MKYGLASDDQKTFRIYCLKDPEIGTIHYVGMTANLLSSRLSDHCKPGKNSRRAIWIRETRRRTGQKPIIELLESHFGWRNEALVLEKKWISHFRGQGVSLVN